MKVQVDFSKAPTRTPYQLAIMDMQRTENLDERGCSLSTTFQMMGGTEEVVDSFLEWAHDPDRSEFPWNDPEADYKDLMTDDPED